MTELQKAANRFYRYFVQKLHPNDPNCPYIIKGETGKYINIKQIAIDKIELATWACQHKDLCNGTHT